MFLLDLRIVGWVSFIIIVLPGFLYLPSYLKLIKMIFVMIWFVALLFVWLVGGVCGFDCFCVLFYSL